MLLKGRTLEENVWQVLIVLFVMTMKVIIWVYWKVNEDTSSPVGETKAIQERYLHCLADFLMYLPLMLRNS